MPAAGGKGNSGLLPGTPGACKLRATGVCAYFCVLMALTWPDSAPWFFPPCQEGFEIPMGWGVPTDML